MSCDLRSGLGAMALHDSRAHSDAGAACQFEGNRRFSSLTMDSVWSSAVQATEDVFRSTAPKLLFQGRRGSFLTYLSSYDSSKDGAVIASGSSPLRVITDWTAFRALS